MNNVKEKSLDIVFPQPKVATISGDKEILEQTINNTLIRLEHYLKRIKKYSIKDFTSYYPAGLLEEDGSGVFDDFWISEEEDGTYRKIFKCRFYYWEDSKTLCFQYTKNIETEWYFIGVEEQEVLGFRKSKLNTSIDRIRRCAIWIASQMFRDCFDEKGLDEVFMRSVFAEEHNFIDWDGFFYPRSWIQYQ